MSQPASAAGVPISATLPGRSSGPWLPWLLFDLTCILTALGFVFLALSWSAPVPDTFAFRGHAGLLALAFGSVGQFMARRRPQNLIGWLFLLAGSAGALQESGQEYAAYATFVRADLTWATRLVAWMASWVITVGLAAIMSALLLFPDGRLPSKRWRLFAWVQVGLWMTTLVNSMLKPGPLRFAPYFVNPFAGSENLWELVMTITGAALAVSIVAMGGAVILRLRRAKGIERQQLKWFTYTGALVCGVGIIYTTAYRTLVVTEPGWAKLSDLLAVVIPLAIPFSVGFAILRYHLYDIDLLIRRTLIYGALTAMLAVIYYASVLLLEELWRRLTGQGQPDVVLVLSTLLIAALSVPLRNRVQQMIDRHFYRRKYDAQKVLTGFGERVRDEVDLSKLTDSLMSVVEETMQPESVSVWVREAGKGKGGITR